jgi:hypothetical protein
VEVREVAFSGSRPRGYRGYCDPFSIGGVERLWKRLE